MPGSGTEPGPFGLAYQTFSHWASPRWFETDIILPKVSKFIPFPNFAELWNLDQNYVNLESLDFTLNQKF